MSLQRDVLFVIKAPFEDGGAMWFCHDCAAMEGMLLANPQWAHHIDVRRIPFPRPRHDIIALIGEENQSMPVLVMADDAKAPEGAMRAQGLAYLTNTRAIGRYLAGAHGGAGPHP